MERHSTTAPSNDAMHVTASDSASAASKSSATKARVNASRQCPKMSLAMAASSASSLAQPIAAATTGQPAPKSLSCSVRSQNSMNPRTSGSAPLLGGGVDAVGDRVAGPAQRLGQDLISALGEVVVDRTAGRAAAGQHLVDRHAGGAALAHHLGGADQHVASRRTPLGSRLGRRHGLKSPHAACWLRSCAGRQPTAAGGEAEERPTTVRHTVRELVAGEVELDDPHRVPPTGERRRCRLADYG